MRRPRAIAAPPSACWNSALGNRASARFLDKDDRPLTWRAQGRCAPSSSDAGTTGSLLYDFYWGMELYPRLGRAFDLKTWTNCRMGMMGWAVLVLCYAAAQARPPPQSNLCLDSPPV